MGKRLSEEVVSDSDESMEDAPETTDAVEKKSQKVSDSASENDTSSSESGSGSESESESESESDSDNKNTNSRLSYNNKKGHAFFPPSGFKQSKAKTRPSPAISSALSNLEGKQVFHITAPSSLSISRIQEIAFGKAMLGEPILSHKGVDYGLVPNEQQQKQGSETLLVYDEVTNTFVRKPELKNIESYNIQEIVRLPGLDSLVPETTSKKQSKARPQPKHLRMRFHPVGSQNLPPETVGSSSESEAEEPTFRVPRKDLKGKSEKDLKRKADNEDASEAKSKKSKKEKPSSQETDTRRDKEKKSSKNRDETSQERRARKEEKKKRKAEKTH